MCRAIGNDGSSISIGSSISHSITATVAAPSASNSPPVESLASAISLTALDVDRRRQRVEGET